MARLQDHFSSQNSNRVAEAIFLYAEQETQLKISNPIESRRDNYDVELKINYYKSILREYRKTKDRLEKNALRYVRHEIRRLQGQLKPNLFNRIYYSDIAELLKTWMRGEKDPVSYYQKAIREMERERIQNYNVQSLSTQLKKAGFNLEMEGALKRMVAQNFQQFHLRYADVENPNAHYVVHFEKIPQTNLYYFKKFEAVSRPSLEALLNNDINCQRQTFFVHDEYKVNASEAAALVNGRSVCKTIDGEQQWLMLDRVSMRNDQYLTMRFDLEKALLNLPIKERENPAKYQTIISALQKGQRKEVTLLINNNSMKFALQAEPRRKAVDVLDQNNRWVDWERLLNLRETTKAVFQKVNDQELNLNQRQGQRIG
jgi:hypothetical protein